MVYGKRLSGSLPFVIIGATATFFLGSPEVSAQTSSMLFEGTRQPDKLLRFGRGSVLVGTEVPGPAILTMYDERIEIAPGVSKLVPAGAYQVTIEGQTQEDIYVERGRVSVITYSPGKSSGQSGSGQDAALNNSEIDQPVAPEDVSGGELAGTIQVQDVNGLITLFSTDGRSRHLSFAKPRSLAPGDYTLRYGLNPKNVNIELLPGENERILPSHFNLAYLTLAADLLQDVTLVFENEKTKTIASGKTYAIQAGEYRVLYGQSQSEQRHKLAPGQTQTFSIVDFPVGYITSVSSIPGRYIKDTDTEIPIAEGQVHALSEGTYQLYEDEVMLWEFEVNPGKTVVLE